MVFYDYDEITSLARCVFRELPESSDPIEEMAAEPWFAVGPDDVFPRSSRVFWGSKAISGRLSWTSTRISSPRGWWQETQRRVAAGEVIDIFPYEDRLRLGHAGWGCRC